MATRTLVLGVGNLLLGDEGFGVHAIRLLEKEGVPEGVVLEDGGTAGVDLLDLMTAFDRVILIDLLHVAPRETPPGSEAGREAGGESGRKSGWKADGESDGESGGDGDANAIAHAIAIGNAESEVVRGSGAMGGLVTGGDVRRDPVPGAVVVFRLNRVELLNPDPSFSLHGCSLGGLIRLARALDVALPDITVIGTVPERVAWTTELSPAAARAVRGAAAAVRELLAGEVVAA